MQEVVGDEVVLKIDLSVWEESGGRIALRLGMALSDGGNGSEREVELM